MTPASVKASYRRMLDQVGEPILVRRYTGTGPNRPKADVEVRARVTGYEPHELIGAIQQGDRKVILLAEDLVAGGFALPITSADKVVVRGKELAIHAPDDSSRRIAGELVAYELQVRG
ncbi:MAG: hypothetical protein GEU95_25325 [Rhizobiales bacterium]|nr:hypothetical protein [Hyphomicrobiales bacterium]